MKEIKFEDGKTIKVYSANDIMNYKRPVLVKIEGDQISFDYVRQMNGQDVKIIWTGTLSGDEIKLRRGVGGGMPGTGR